MIEILGYTDRLAVRPGETIEFKVSRETGAGSYRADIVRLRCGDDRPGGPGFQEELVADAVVNGDYQGRKQEIDCGSYVNVPPTAAFNALAGFELSCLIWPTLPGVGEQTVMGRWSGECETGTGYALTIGSDGKPCLRLGADGKIWRLVFPVPVTARRWHRLTAHVESRTSEVRLLCVPLEARWGDRPAIACSAKSPLAIVTETDTPFTIAAHVVRDVRRGWRGAGHFNGKIEAPGLRDGDDRLVARWDFAQDISGIAIRDTGPHRLDGACINLPTRAMTGHNWSAEVMNWRQRPEEYAAIHFMRTIFMTAPGTPISPGPFRRL